MCLHGSERTVGRFGNVGVRVDRGERKCHGTNRIIWNLVHCGFWPDRSLSAPLWCLTSSRAEEVSLTNLSGLDLRNTRAEVVLYRGRQALKLTDETPGAGEIMAILRSSPFHNGSIEIDVAGALASDARASDRGFIGVAFRIHADVRQYECIYIRPTNGRSEDQLRRNHATQYVSMPDWPWYRLRKESPGVYESYADMAEGEWLHVRIVVRGKNAALYLGASSQPCLLVHDLKLGDSQGAIALWGGSGTIGYFANLAISRDK
jgi:hypothetical protein